MEACLQRLVHMCSTDGVALVLGREPSTAPTHAWLGLPDFCINHHTASVDIVAGTGRLERCVVVSPWPEDLPSVMTESSPQPVHPLQLAVLHSYVFPDMMHVTQSKVYTDCASTTPKNA